MDYIIVAIICLFVGWVLLPEPETVRQFWKRLAG